MLKKIVKKVAGYALVGVLYLPIAMAQSDAVIIDTMIRESKARYAGRCACPDDLAKNGARCGKRSAYSKPGGARPLCYAKDLSQAMISAYRKARR